MGLLYYRETRRRALIGFSYDLMDRPLGKHAARPIARVVMGPDYDKASAPMAAVNRSALVNGRISHHDTPAYRLETGAGGLEKRSGI